MGVKRAAYNNSSVIGDTYQVIGNLKKSEHYFRITLAKAKEIGEPSLKGYAYNNLQITYLAMDSTDVALLYLDSALLYIPPAQKHSVLNNIGVLYAERLNNQDSAIAYFDKAIQVAPDPMSKVGPLLGKGIALSRKRKPHEGVLLIKQGMSISPELKDVGFADRQEVFKDISEVFYSSGDYKSGYKHLFKAVEIQDSLLSIEQEAQVKLLAYETQVRQLKIREQELELEKQELNLKQRFYLLLGVGALALLAFSFGIILYKRNEKLAIFNNKLASANKQLEYLSDETHHRVKNDYQSISSMLFVQQNEIQNEQVKQTLLSVRDRILAMGQIHMLFYKKGNYFKMGLAKYLHDLVNMRAKALASQYVKANVNVSIDIDNSIEQKVSFDEAKQLGVVINELITNVFKHAFNGDQSPVITFRAFVGKQQKDLIILISDNGIGMESDVIPKNDNSFGLKMINNACKQLGWKFETESTGKGKGTTFTITINTEN